jgi:hypothetical protein
MKNFKKYFENCKIWKKKKRGFKGDLKATLKLFKTKWGPEGTNLKVCSSI